MLSCENHLEERAGHSRRRVFYDILHLLHDREKQYFLSIAAGLPVSVPPNLD